MIVASIIANLIAKAVSSAVSRPDVPASPAAIEPITREVIRQVQPQIEHLTNNEPWWASRVMWGVIVSVGSGLAAAAGFQLTGEDQAMAINLFMAAGTVVGGCITLYGRFRARKPIGR
jgi:hypothetical protein